MASNRSPGFRGDALGYVVSEKKYSLRFSHISLCKTDKPRDGAIFCPGVIICRTLVPNFIQIRLRVKNFPIDSHCKN